MDLVRKDPLSRQIALFVEVVRGNAEPLVTARDGFENLRVTEAITEAAASGTVIELARA